MYPLYPPELSVNIDYDHLQSINLPYTPDILLLPSDLQHFTKNVSGVLCVNPGKVSKNTFVHATVESKENSTGLKVIDRTRYDIVKM